MLLLLQQRFGRYPFLCAHTDPERFRTPPLSCILCGYCERFHKNIFFSPFFVQKQSSVNGSYGYNFKGVGNPAGRLAISNSHIVSANISSYRDYHSIFRLSADFTFKTIQGSMYQVNQSICFTDRQSKQVSRGHQ